MGRFSCFYGHVYNNKQKGAPQKSSQPSFETMVKMLQLGSQKNESENVNHLSEHDNHMVKSEPSDLRNGARHLTLASHSSKSGELNRGDDAESNADSVHSESGNFRRSLSVGCEIDRKGRIFGGNNDDDCIPQDFSCQGSQDHDDSAEVSPTIGANSMTTSLPDQYQEVPESVSPQLSSDLVNHTSLYDVDNPQYLSKQGHEQSHLLSYTEYPNDSGCKSTTQSRISKCCSMPDFGSMSLSPGLPLSVIPSSRNRSSEDLLVLSTEQENASAKEAGAVEVPEVNRANSFYNPEKFDGENAVLDAYDSCHYGCSSKDWIVPMQNEIDIMGHGGENSSYDHWDHITNKDFKIKQIEDWVADLQHCSPLEETNEVADSEGEVIRESASIDNLSKVEMKVNPGMELAKRYISSLNATATNVQLANYGLLAIPLLSAFVSLKVLNLSGNSIVRITVGVLPRGLHMLNLSKNKIATIEGLRELTRLRVLDLSYNKISRIGHGLASCSTLKELYLAGNKISEVEGLHRLLKLIVLDLRFNKIATSKCLGQLAANYNSLQAISLEGNPAQKNVGDEQLKKNLQSLLPQLAYYNRQNIKTSTLKDSSDRAVRLGISDRGLRSDHKSSSRWGSGATKRSCHSSIHGQKGQASDSLKQSKGKHVLVPPSGTKSSHHHYPVDIGNKLQSLRSGLSIPKSRSEGTLAVL